MHQVDERHRGRVDGAHLLAAMAAHGLPGAPPFPDTVTDGDAFALVTTARLHRLTGPLLAAVRDGAGALPGEAEELLVDAHRQALIGCLQLERRLLEVDDVLSGAGVPLVVVKGPAVAHLDRPDPADRLWSDVDILVPPDHLDRAVGLLLAQGGDRSYAEPRPGWDRRFGKSVEIRGADHIEVDVHRSLADGVYGERIPLEHLHATTEPLELSGRTLRALSGPGRVLHAAYHAVVGSITPSWANRRDLAWYLTQETAPLADVVAEARRWGGEAVLAAAVDLVRRDLGVAAAPWYRWVDHTVIDPREQRLVSRLRHGDTGVGRARLDLLRELPSWRDRSRYVRGLVQPVDAHDSLVARTRRWVPQLLRRAGGSPPPTGEARDRR